ncbi:MAG: hypothetical protein V3W18_09340 [candidate division Zixibacteria bacterium]
MRKYSASLLAVILLTGNTTLFAQSKTTYKAFSPSDNGKSVILKSDSKRYKYFTLDKTESVGFEVSGPTKVKIRTRALLPEKASSGDYSITVWEGERVKSGRKAETKASKLTADGIKGKIGVARDIFIKVPKGKHKYVVTFQSDNIDKAFLRFHQEKKKKKKRTYEPFRPYEYASKVKLKSGESRISYYLIDENGGARLKIIGPSSVKIYCRANFDPTMKEKSKFTLGVFENGKTVKKFSAVTKKSSKSLYTDLPELIPSKLHTFTLKIPDGEHVYEFKKINSSPNSLAARFKILKSSLGKKK